MENVPEFAKNEIRIIISGGSSFIKIGNEVPSNIIVSICDYDIDGMTKEEQEEECSMLNGDPCIFRSSSEMGIYTG